MQNRPLASRVINWLTKLSSHKLTNKIAASFIAGSSGGIRARFELTYQATCVPMQCSEGTGMLAVFIVVSIGGTGCSLENSCPKCEQPAHLQSHATRADTLLRHGLARTRDADRMFMQVLRWL